MKSSLEKHRLEYKPKIPPISSPQPIPVHTTLSHLFPHLAAASKLPPKTHPRTGVVFSGGPAAGGHNVIAALFDHIGPLIGFLDGPAGIVNNKTKPLNSADINLIRNQGGFDLLGSGRDKIETPEQLSAALRTVQNHKLDALVVIGGDDSNTNAAVLAEYFLAHKAPVQVIGIPKTIDGDLRSPEMEISFGFDSACKTYSELIGNVARDAVSSRKYYHFIKLMGRSASHIALECALATQPNLVLISEEKKPLKVIVSEITDLIRRRAAAGKNYGIVLIPEGLVEFVPDLQESVPHLEHDAHGNLAVSQIETEKLLVDLVQKQIPFQAQTHFFGYEGRCCLPSNFDANYTYALGVSAAAALRSGLTGMICGMKHMHKTPEQWLPTFTPLVNLLHLEVRKNKEKPVIAKALVDLHGKPYKALTQHRKRWELDDLYLQPGPMQFFGPSEITDSCPLIIS